MEYFNLALLMGAPAGGGSSTGSMTTSLVTFALVIGIFYFLIIRPQNKKQKDTQSMINAMKKGDKVVTIGGIRGTVLSVKDDTVIVKVDDDTKLEMNKSAVSAVLNAEAVKKVDKKDKKDQKEKAEKK